MPVATFEVSPFILREDASRYLPASIWLYRAVVVGAGFDAPLMGGARPWFIKESGCPNVAGCNCCVGTCDATWAGGS